LEQKTALHAQALVLVCPNQPLELAPGKEGYRKLLKVPADLTHRQRPEQQLSARAKSTFEKLRFEAGQPPGNLGTLGLALPER
jgi:hypothetical protein